MASPSIVPITQQVADLRGLIALTTGKEQESYKQELADLLRAPATAGELYAAGTISKSERDSRSLDSDAASPAMTELYAAGDVSRPSTVARYAAGQISKAERDRRLGKTVELPTSGDTFISDPSQVDRLTQDSADDVIHQARTTEAGNYPGTAAAVGAADAASFGLVSQGLRAIAKQNPDALAMLKEANPMATSLGEAGGHLVAGYGAGGAVNRGANLALRGGRAALSPAARIGLAGAEGAVTGAGYSAAQAAGHGAPADQVAQSALDAVSDPLQLAANVGLPLTLQGVAEAGRAGVSAARKPGSVYAQINANRELETPEMKDIPGWDIEGELGATTVAQDSASKMADKLAQEMVDAKADYHTADTVISDGPGRVTVPYEGLHEGVARGLRRSDADPSVFMSDDALGALEALKRKTTGSVPGQPPGEPTGFVDYDPRSARPVVDTKYVDVEASPLRPATDPTAPPPSYRGETIPIPEGDLAFARDAVLSFKAEPGETPMASRERYEALKENYARLASKTGGTGPRPESLVTGEPIPADARTARTADTTMPVDVATVMAKKRGTVRPGVETPPGQATAYAQAGGREAPAVAPRKRDLRLVDDTVMMAKELNQLRKYPESGSPGALERTEAMVEELKAKMTPEELSMFEDRLTNPGALVGRPAAPAPEGVANRGQRYQPKDPGPIMYEPTEPQVIGKAAAPVEVTSSGTPKERAILDKIHLWSIRVKKGDKTSLNNLRDLATQLSQAWKDPNITSAQKANTRALYAGVMEAIRGWPGAVERAVTPRVSGTAATEMLSPRTVDEAVRARRLTEEAQAATDLDQAMREDYSRRATDAVIDQQLAFKKPLNKFRGDAKQFTAEDLAVEDPRIEAPEEAMQVGEVDPAGIPEDFNPDVLRNFDRTKFKEQVGEFYSKAGVPGRMFAKYNARFDLLAQRRPDLAPLINAIRAKTAKELSKFGLSKNARLATNAANIGRGMLSHNLDWLILTGTKKNGWMEKAVNLLEKAPQALRAPAAEKARTRKER